MTIDPDLIAAIRERYPDSDPKTVLSQLARELAGPIPSYSGRHGLANEWDFNPTTTLHAASYALPYFGEGDDPYVVLIKRRERNRNDEQQIGMPGGFLNPDFVGDIRPPASTPQNTPGEQPEVAARRELMEELIKPDGKPVIMPDVDRFKHVGSTIDYRRFSSPATYNATYGLKLTAAEFDAIKAHQAKLEQDPAYLEASKRASNGEINGVQVMKLSELAAVMEENRGKIRENREAIESGEINAGSVGAFAHPHEMDMIAEFSAIRFTGQERDYIDQFLLRAKEELARRISPPVGDKWEIASFVDRYSLEGAEQCALQNEELSVAFRIPSREEAHSIANGLIKIPLLKSFHDRPDIRKYLEGAVHRMVDRRFYPPGQPRGWEEVRQAGDRTVRFTAVAHDAFPLPEALQDRIDAQAEFSDTIVSINGVPLVRQGYAKDLEKHFGGAVLLAEQFEKQQQASPDNMRFQPFMVVDDSQAPISVWENRQVVLGDAFLSVVKENPEYASMSMLHERGHVANGDSEYDNPEVLHTQACEHLDTLFLSGRSRFQASDEKDVPFSYCLPLVTTLIEEYQNNPDKLIHELYSLTEQKEEGLQRFLTRANEEYGAIRDRYRAAAAHIERYPGFEELEAQDLIDPEEYRRFAGHVLALEPSSAVETAEIPNLIIARQGVVEFRNERREAEQEQKILRAIGAGKAPVLPSNVWVIKQAEEEKDPVRAFEERYPQPPEEVKERIRVAMDKLVQDHGQLHDDAVTISFAARHLGHAKEYLADFHVAEHGRPEVMQQFLAQYAEDRDAMRPASSKSIEAIGNFTAAIRAEREKVSRPVSPDL